MTLAEVRAAMHAAYVGLVTALTKTVKGEPVGKLEAEILQDKIDNLKALEHALERVEALAYASQEDEE